ncbi:unnamed protein product [Adineta ricciae]|nr:unnamed protein product [Adineta ricciae]
MVLLLAKETNRRAHVILEQWNKKNADTAYPLNAEVYMVRQPGATATTKDASRIRNLVKRLVHTWINKRRSITTDNYFNSAELAEDLLGVQTTLTIVDDEKKKPEIILYYNSIKGDVDHMDQMVQTYSFDVGAIAAFVVWTTRNPQWNEKKNYRRRLFLMEVGYDLLQLHLDRRQHQPRALQKNVRLVTCESFFLYNLTQKQNHFFTIDVTR